MEVNGQLHALATLLLGKDTSMHCIEGWMGPRTSLNMVAKTKCPFHSADGN